MALLEVGTQAPDFRVKNLTDPTEPEISLSDFAGKKGVVLVFTKPVASKKQVDPVVELYQSCSHAVEFLACQRKAPISPSAIRSTLKAWGVTFPFFLDNEGSIFALYGVESVPTAYFIAKDGTIRDVGMPEGSSQDLVQDLAERIKKHFLTA